MHWSADTTHASRKNELDADPCQLCQMVVQRRPRVASQPSHAPAQRLRMCTTTRTHTEQQINRIHQTIGEKCKSKLTSPKKHSNSRPSCPKAGHVTMVQVIQMNHLPSRPNRQLTKTEPDPKHVSAVGRGGITPGERPLATSYPEVRKAAPHRASQSHWPPGGPDRPCVRRRTSRRPDAMSAAIDELLTAKPHLAARKPICDIGRGS